MRALIFAATLITGPALADCPTAADLIHGIRLTDATGATEVFRSQSTHMMSSQWSDAEGFGTRLLLAKGLYVVESIDTDYGKPVPDSRITYAYPVGAADFPDPTPGGRWDTENVTRDEDGLSKGRESHVFGRLARQTIGKCSYDMIPVTTTYHDDDGYVEVLRYLPELGIAYMAESRTKNEQPDLYTIVRIEAVTP